MKIGIISSGQEMLALFSFLSRYEHEYLVYYDSLHAPYGEKNFLTSLQAVEQGIARLKNVGVEAIILPPVYELALLKKGEKLILPLFHSYLFEEIFPHSLVGKLGLLGEFADLQVAQELITDLSSQYSPTEAQCRTKAFSFPFHFRVKEVGILNPLLTRLSRKSFLTNTLLKHELRFFKDAHIDTLIPLNYLYFNAETTISKFLNFKKIRFHRLFKLEQVFSEITQKEKKSEYSVHVHATDQKQHFLREKRMLRKLQRGKSVEVQRS